MCFQKRGGLQEECLCPDCGKDVKLRKDRVQAVVGDAEYGDFKRIINARRREESKVILDNAEMEMMRMYHESSKRDDK